MPQLVCDRSQPEVRGRGRCHRRDFSVSASGGSEITAKGIQGKRSRFRHGGSGVTLLGSPGSWRWISPGARPLKPRDSPFERATLNASGAVKLLQILQSIGRRSVGRFRSCTSRAILPTGTWICRGSGAPIEVGAAGRAPAVHRRTAAAPSEPGPAPPGTASGRNAGPPSDRPDNAVPLSLRGDHEPFGLDRQPRVVRPSGSPVQQVEPVHRGIRIIQKEQIVR